jgi:hypothetical protein
VLFLAVGDKLGNIYILNREDEAHGLEIGGCDYRGGRHEGSSSCCTEYF